MAPEQLRFDPGSQRSPCGHPLDECVSALQKCIRRGNERENENERLAIYFALELADAGYPGWCWRRLKIITAEDALAWKEGAAVIRALAQNGEEARKAKKPGDERLYLVAAVILLCRAPKSRVADNALLVLGDPARRAAMRVEVPSFARDHHTRAGRVAGATEARCFDESYKIVGQALDDPYAQEARRLEVSSASTTTPEDQLEPRG